MYCSCLILSFSANLYKAAGLPIIHTYQASLLFPLLDGFVIPENSIVHIDTLLKLMKLHVEIRVLLSCQPQTDCLVQVIKVFFFLRRLLLLTLLSKQGRSPIRHIRLPYLAIQFVEECYDIVLIRDVIVSSFELEELLSLIFECLKSSLILFSWLSDRPLRQIVRRLLSLHSIGLLLKQIADVFCGPKFTDN